jgi:hypothetical protein
VWVCALLLTLCAAFTAGYDAFISLAKYDDEGYMMWTVKNFLAGRPLYDQVVTVYGPFYYLYEWVILSITGAPAASDSLRLVSAAFWVAAALVAFLLAYRATGSLVLAAVVHLLAFRALGFIGEETAHPQEACILLLLALGRAFYIADRKLRVIMMGVLGGAMVATKINLGIFVVVTLAVGLTYAQPRGLRRSLACIAVSLGTLALPLVLMWDRRTDIWVICYCALIFFSLASTLLAVLGLPWKGSYTPRDAALVAGVFAATAAAICCFPLTQGSTLKNLFQWLIVMPYRWSQSWSLAPNIHPWALLWAAVGVVFAWFVYKDRVAEVWLAALKLAFGIAVIPLCATDRYGGLLNFATPFLWLVAVRPMNAANNSVQAPTRALLALLAVIQALYAYPVAGSQVGLVAVFMIVIAGICFWDAVAWWRSSRFGTRFNRNWKWAPLVVRGTAAVLIAGVSISIAWNARRTYQSFAALDFPGARHVRVEPEKAAALRAIVSRINSSCGTLVTEPGLFSFHLWTGKPSLPGLDHQVWMLLDDASQDAIVREIAGDPRACVVYHQEVVDFWTRGTNVSAKPGVRFIRENFETVFEGSGYCLMMRRPAG